MAAAESHDMARIWRWATFTNILSTSFIPKGVTGLFLSTFFDKKCKNNLLKNKNKWKIQGVQAYKKNGLGKPKYLSS